MLTITKDGRTIREGPDYTAFRKELFDSQRGRCFECGAWTNLEAPIEFDGSFHVAHRGSRGMGSSFRDDVIGPKKGQVKGGLCGDCHRKEHGQ